MLRFGENANLVGHRISNWKLEQPFNILNDGESKHYLSLSLDKYGNGLFIWKRPEDKVYGLYFSNFQPMVQKE